MTSRFLGGGGGGNVIKQFGGDTAGGFAGGAAAGMISNGPSWNSFWEGGVAGAGGAAAGSLLGFAGRRALKHYGPKADEGLSEARDAHAGAVDEANALDRADDAVEAAGKKWNDAEAAVGRAEDSLTTAQDRLRRAEANLAANPGDDALQARVGAAQDRVDAAEDALTAAKRARDEAGDEVDSALRAYDDADAAAPRMEDAADAAAVAERAAQRKADMWGTSGHVAKYGHPSLVALGSGFAVGAGPIDWGSGGGGGPGGGGTVPLVWDGRAAAAGLAGKPPFTETETNPGVVVTLGQGGFLLRPQALSPELITAFSGATGSFAATVVDVYKMSGDLEKKIELRLDPAPRMPQGITVGSGSGTDSYEEATDRVDTALDELYKSELGNKETAAKVEDISATVKDSVASVINGHNSQVQQLTSTDLEINFMKLVSQGFDELIGILENAANAMDRAASGIEDPSAGDAAAAKRLNERVGSLENSLNNPALWPDGSQIKTPDPGGLDNLGVGTPNLPGTASADLADAAKQMQDRSNDALEASTPDIPTAPSSSLGGIANPMAAAAGNNQMDSLFRTMMNQMMMSKMLGRNAADSDLARRVDDLDPSRYDVAAQPQMPATRPAATTPWSTQPATPQTPAQPANHQSGPPAGATSNQTGSGMPRRVPGADGLVVYPLPDGRTQKITLTRALGLDKGFANKSGTDAQAAYAGTPAAFTDHKDIGMAIDPSQLSTGDVAMWRRSAKEDGKVPAGANAVVGTAVGGPANDDNSPAEGAEKPEGRQSGDPGGEPEYRTALLVVFGDGESGTVEAIVQGELQPFDPELADADGPMGEFAGFKRPNGLEDTGADGQDTDTAMNTDQPVADMPALAGPA
ncbi:hypothetical protein [Nocardia carnea]|uniref:Uncharacterized protein n=1 Tax=Nocardia carnea TaxID=37328 RepID=A0ABW7TJ08_9NOCA|nr:hypothetical protein [Nocardia carnea]